MNFSLELTCDNAAFGPTFEDATAEIARILRLAAVAVDAANVPQRRTAYNLRDINGHIVGTWSLA
jgi:hypothetical protein